MTKQQCDITLFFENHLYADSSKALISLLPNLNKQGFKALVLDENQDKTADEIVDFYKTNNAMMGNPDDFFKTSYLLIEAALKISFDLQGVDLIRTDYDKSEIRHAIDGAKRLKTINQCSLDKKIDSYKAFVQEKCVIKSWNEFLASDHIHGRSAGFADQIDQLCQKTNASIIGVFGWIHGELTEILAELGYNQIVSFFLLNPEHIANPTTLDDVMLAYAPDRAYSQLFSSTELIRVEQFSSSTELDSYLLDKMSGLDSVCYNHEC